MFLDTRVNTTCQGRRDEMKADEWGSVLTDGKNGFYVVPKPQPGKEDGHHA